MWNNSLPEVDTTRAREQPRIKINQGDEAVAEQSGNFSRTLFWWILSVCIASLPEYQHQSGAARLHIHPEGTQTHQQLTYTGQEEASRPNMCPKGLLFLSHVRLWGCFFFLSAGGGRRNSSPDRFRHTGFLLQPQRHMERPYFYQGRA